MTRSLGCVSVLLMLLSGCSADITEEAQQVVLHPQPNAVLAGCERLGNVSGLARGFLLDLEREKAIHNMRDTAFRKYGADTAALANVDEIGGGLRIKKFVAQGIAFRCEP